MGHPATGRVAGTESQGNIAVPFTRGEKIALWALVAAFIAPVTTWDGKLFLATEIAMMAFVAVAHWRVNRLARVVPLLAVLAVPLAFAFGFPSRGFSLLIAGLVYVKLAVFAYFVYILVERCWNTENVGWLAKNVILPVALVLCLSALVDRYTDWPFFALWHRRVTYVTNSTFGRLVRDYGANLELIAGIMPPGGLATRTSDIPPWALLGLASTYWLRKNGQMGEKTSLAIIVSLLAATFSMPKRSAIVLFSVVTLAFLLIMRSRADRRWKVLLLVLVIVIAGVSQVVGTRYVVGSYVETIGSSALARLLQLQFRGGRLETLPWELKWLLDNPRELLLGTGWNLQGGLWSKPHNSYIGLVVGGGLCSLIPLLIATMHLFQLPMAERGQIPPGGIGLVLLIALSVELFINPYFFGRLEFPASTLAVWLAWSAILYRTPADART